jgi:hypothetical protein
MNDTERLAAAADRLDELAETADLMGDEAGAAELREQSNRARMEAMNRLPPKPITE